MLWPHKLVIELAKLVSKYIGDKTLHKVKIKKNTLSLKKTVTKEILYIFEKSNQENQSNYE